MTSCKYYYYFTEGENEEKLIDVLKTEFQVIPSGRVEKLNVLTHLISNVKILTLQKNATVIFVFDTDDDSVKLDIFHENVKRLKRCRSVRNLFCITQVRNIEDELVRSTDIRAIEELLPSKSRKSFKNDFNRMELKNLARKLEEHNFNISLLWSRQPQGKLAETRNDSDRIKYSK